MIDQKILGPKIADELKDNFKKLLALLKNKKIKFREIIEEDEDDEDDE